MRQLISSTDIDSWFSSSRRDAQGLLPHIVRRLISATVDFDAIKLMRIPVGDDINMPGFDGEVQVTAGHRYVPTGLSYWEMGTGPSASKAAQDYLTRTDTTPAEVRANAAFVIVTPHRWAAKDSWIREKQNERAWKEIRVLDSSDLEEWLEFAPGVGRWLATQMGNEVKDLYDVGLFWTEQEARYRCTIPPGLVVGGREWAASRLKDWLTGGSSVITLEGESQEEAAVFAAGAILSLPKALKEWALARTLLAAGPGALDRLAASPTKHFVIPLTMEAVRRAKALRREGLRLICPSERLPGSNAAEGLIRLGTLVREATEHSLLAADVPRAMASRIARDSKGSLTAALWMMGQGPDAPLPWTIRPAARDLAPLLLVGRWVADAPADQSVVQTLSAKTYSEAAEIAMKWQSPLGPLTRRFAVYDWVAPDFAWTCLAPAMDLDLICRFKNVVTSVLGTPDPKLELPLDQQWAAPVYGKSHPYSAELRSGLVSSLVQLALTGDELPGGRGQALVSRIVEDLLAPEGTARAAAWQSNARWLPDLAEAAPSAFLKGVESLTQDPSATSAVFSGDSMFGGHAHVYVLGGSNVSLGAQSTFRWWYRRSGPWLRWIQVGD